MDSGRRAGLGAEACTPELADVRVHLENAIERSRENKLEEVPILWNMLAKSTGRRKPTRKCHRTSIGRCHILSEASISGVQ